MSDAAGGAGGDAAGGAGGDAAGRDAGRDIAVGDASRDLATDGGNAADEPPESEIAQVNWLPMGVALALVWIAVRGVDATPVRLGEELLIGLALGLPIAYGGRHFYEPVTGLDMSLRPAPYAVMYVATFLYELVTANVDVAWRVLAPSMPIEPAVVEMPLRVESDLAITTIANSITLTPGTLTMDYDRERNVLYVHSIDGSDPEAVVEPIRRWEDYALVIFDEPLKPGDPVPPARTAGAAEETGSDGDDPEVTDD